MTDASVSSLGYLEIGASNLEDWQRYGEKILGVEVRRTGGALYLRYDEATWRIRITESDRDDITCVGFSVDSAEALATIRRRLASQGVSVAEAGADQARARGVDNLLTCKEPGGLNVELYVGARASNERFESPAGVSGFVTGAQGLGHIVLAVPDIDAANRFYMEGLGFRLSDYINMGPPGRAIKLTFLHCNPRHHTLAMVPAPLPKRLHHIMLQVESMDDVGLGLDRAKKAGISISSALGKHTNDQMTSFYMKTPSGFDIEYGFGGIEIDDAIWQTTTYDSGSIWGHGN